MSLFVKAAGGNASAAATWSSVSSLGVDNSGPPTSTDDCFADLNSGQLTIDAATAMKSFSATDGVGDYAGTITHNAFNLTVSGSITFVAGMTYTPLATSTITIAANSTLISAGKLFPLMSVNNAITLTLGDNLTMMASKVITISLVGNSLTLNGFTLSGNSATNRVLIQSNTLGTVRTLTVAGGTFANADFRDIRFSNATDLNLSSITGFSGDCGGNTITGGGTTLTFTPSATQTYTGGTGSWSDITKWTSRVPLPQDNVSMSGVTGGTITNDMPRMGGSINWTGAGGSPTWALSTSNQTIYGSLTMISAMTLTATQTTIFEGRSSFTLTSAGQVFANGSIIFNTFGGTMTLLDNLSITITATTTQINNGTFNANNFNLIIGGFNSSGSGTRTINMGSGSWTFTGTGVVAAFSSTGMTLNPGSSTMIISNTGASSKTFTGGGLTYNNLQITGGGSGAVIITGANTFKSIRVIGGTKSITLPGSTTTTLLGESSLGNGTNLITFTASAGSATIAQNGGVVNWDYVSLTNIPASGTAAFYAGPTTHSTDGGGNTNWIFTNAPGGGGSGTSAFAPGGVLGLACAGCL